MEYVAPIIAYVLVAHPATYKLTSSFLGTWISGPDGAAKIGGLLLHAVVYLFLTALLTRVMAPKKSGLRLSNLVGVCTGVCDKCVSDPLNSVVCSGSKPYKKSCIGPAYEPGRHSMCCPCK